MDFNDELVFALFEGDRHAVVVNRRTAANPILVNAPAVEEDLDMVVRANAQYAAGFFVHLDLGPGVADDIHGIKQRVQFYHVFPGFQSEPVMG